MVSLPFAALFLLFFGGVAHALTAGAWDTGPAVTPAALLNTIGSALAWDSTTNTIFATKGSGSKTFWRYNVSGNTWSALTDITETILGGADLVAPGNGYVYLSCYCATKYLYRYDIAATTWSAMTNPPGTLGSSASDSSIEFDGGNLIYALSGGGDAKFYSYSISGNSWSTLTNTPDATSDFGTITYPGSGDFIYLLRGSDKRFERYSISGDSYLTMTSPPATSAYPNLTSANGVVYELRGPTAIGTGKTDFYSYSVSGNSWTTLAVTPADIDVGNDIVGIGSASAGFSLYATQGGSSDVFYRYTISLAASTGGSAGSFLLRAQQDAGYSLARATSPAVPANVVVTPTPCNGTCGASIAFSYSPLPAHQGRPVTFAFIDEFGKTLASAYEPFAGTKNYVLDLKNLAPNSPITGRLCAQFSPREGCVVVQSWTLFALDEKSVKVKADVEGDGYRVRVIVPPFTNEGVEASGVRVNVERAAEMALNSARAERMPAAETLLAQITGVFSPTQAGASHTTVVAPAEAITVLPLLRAAPKTINDGVLVPSKIAPAPVAEKLPGTFLAKSGEWQAVLPPGEYRIVLTPVNGKGISGPALTLPLSLAPLRDPITLSARMEIAEGQLHTLLDVALNRRGNTGVDFLTTRAGSAFMLRANEVPAETHLTLTASVVPSAALLKNSRSGDAVDERFEFVFACASGAKTCAVKSALAQKGGVVSRGAVGKNSDGFVTVKTDDAIATVRMTEGVTQVSVTATGELKRLTSEESAALNAFRGGAATLSFSAVDALGNTASIRDVPVNIPGSESAITAFTVATAGDAGDIEAHGVIDYANFAERGLLINLSFTEEGLGAAGSLQSTPQLVQLLMTRDDGTGIQFALSCEASPQAGEASPQAGDKTCSVAAIAAPQGTPLAVAQKEHTDGTVSASAGGVTLTYDAQNAMPVLIGVRPDVTVGASVAGFSRAEVRARYASFGLGNFVGELKANEATAKAAFFGAGRYLNLFPEVVEKVIMNLAPIIINYTAPQTSAPVVESIAGGRVVSQSSPVQLLNVGAPVSPLLNALRKIFGGGQ